MTSWKPFPLQLQVTVPPAAMVTLAGVNLFATSAIPTVALIGAPVAGGGVGVGGTGVGTAGMGVAGWVTGVVALPELFVGSTVAVGEGSEVGDGLATGTVGVAWVVGDAAALVAIVVASRVAGSWVGSDFASLALPQATRKIAASGAARSAFRFIHHHLDRVAAPRLLITLSPAPTEGAWD